MTNYEKLFREQMKNPKFAKAYHEAKLERKLDEMLEDLKEKIYRSESKEVLLETIDSLQQKI
jgi:polyhydroxyalkanoate synthesis regulator phasin